MCIFSQHKSENTVEPCRNPRKYRILKLADDLLCKLTNPQQFSAENVENSVDNVDNLLPQEVFPHFNDISGPHSYQQITLDTFF